MAVAPPFFDPLRFVAAPLPAKTRSEMVAEAAYYLALKRGFQPGHEEEDWLAAEAQIDSTAPLTLIEQRFF